MKQIFTKAKPYFPLIIAFGSVVCWTIFRRVTLGWDAHGAMCDFMGAFFLIFGGLKLITWPRFAESFRRHRRELLRALGDFADGTGDE